MEVFSEVGQKELGLVVESNQKNTDLVSKSLYTKTYIYIDRNIYNICIFMYYTHICLCTCHVRVFDITW